VSSLGGPEFCIVHAADLHLGARRWTQGLPKDPGFRERLLLADRLALRSLIDLCVHVRARVLVCAGDVIDGWCRDATAGLFLAQELHRLREIGCETLIGLGNHDVRSRVMRSLLLPCQASLIGIQGPETRVFEALGLAVHGWSFPSVGVGEDVVEAYPAPLPGLLNLGILHTSAEGCRGHADYAPCSRLALRRKGYAYWALGHVHAREVLATEPWIVFPGNLQGRGHREAGPKGATVVSVRAGRVVAVEHQPLSQLRFQSLVIDEPSLRHFDDLLEAVRAAAKRACREAVGCSLVVRLVVSGVEGSACVLGVPPAERRAAFEHALCGVAPEALFLDEIWIDPGPQCGALRLDVAA